MYMCVCVFDIDEAYVHCIIIYILYTLVDITMYIFAQINESICLFVYIIIVLIVMN